MLSVKRFLFILPCVDSWRNHLPLLISPSFFGTLSNFGSQNCSLIGSNGSSGQNQCVIALSQEQKRVHQGSWRWVCLLCTAVSFWGSLASQSRLMTLMRRVSGSSPTLPPPANRVDIFSWFCSCCWVDNEPGCAASQTRVPTTVVRPPGNFVSVETLSD